MIKIAKHAGFCFGVKNALNIVFKQNKKINVLGPLIHNNQVIEKLNEKGITTIQKVEEVTEGAIAITAHGTSDDIKEKIKKRNIEIIDCTCPLVKKVQQKAKQLEKQGYFVMIIGDKEHTEVKGISQDLKNKLIIKNKNDLDKNIDLIKTKKRIGIVVQTTQNIIQVKKLVNIIKNINLNTIFHNTICAATTNRQKAAKELSKNSDIMIVIGGYHSANTNRLTEICSNIIETKHIETSLELKKKWFKDKKNIGITAGASTPEWIINEVVNKIKELI